MPAGPTYARWVQGRVIVVSSWVADVVFAAVAIPAALGVDALDTAAIAVALGLFAVSLPVWTWAFGTAVVRSTQGDDVVVANLFGTVGGAPRDVRWHLFGSLGVCVAIAAGTAIADPFGVLVPMLPLGFVGLWAARYGTFPPRRDGGHTRGGATLGS
jgi:hypothetical protein